MRMDQLTVGELAERTGTTRRAIRLYEQVGLIAPARGPNGYRLYGEQHVEQLIFIKALRGVGASLKEMAEFYRLKRSGLPEPEKHRQFIALIDGAFERLVRQRQAIDSALAELDGYRQEILDCQSGSISPRLAGIRHGEDGYE